MKVKIEQVTDVGLMRKACQATMHGQESKVSIGKMAQMEHSPLRTIMFWIEMKDIPTFVSVHLVRHKIGVEHFVKSMRNDLYLEEDAPTPDRDTLVNHGMFINAHALMNMMQYRLCYKSHALTVRTMRAIRREMENVCPELVPHLVPKCVYRNGICSEHKECEVSQGKVNKIYVKEV